MKTGCTNLRESIEYLQKEESDMYYNKFSQAEEKNTSLFRLALCAMYNEMKWNGMQFIIS